MGHLGSCDMIRLERSSWFSTPGVIFRLFMFFCWNDLSHKNKNQAYTRCSLMESLFYHFLPPNSTMSSPVVNAKEGMKMTKQTKTKIGVGSIVQAKVGELEKITRE